MISLKSKRTHELALEAGAPCSLLLRKWLYVLDMELKRFYNKCNDSRGWTISAQSYYSIHPCFFR